MLLCYVTAMLLLGCDVMLLCDVDVTLFLCCCSVAVLLLLCCCYVVAMLLRWGYVILLCYVVVSLCGCRYVSVPLLLWLLW